MHPIGFSFLSREGAFAPTGDIDQFAEISFIFQMPCYGM